jgi:hypothetical protein
MRFSCQIDFDPGSRGREILVGEMEEKIRFSSGYLFRSDLRIEEKKEGRRREGGETGQAAGSPGTDAPVG